MDEQPKKRRGPLTWLAARTWRFWVVVVVVLPVLYVGSFGPACRWLAGSTFRGYRDSQGGRFTPEIYWPIRQQLPFVLNLRRFPVAKVRSFDPFFPRTPILSAHGARNGTLAAATTYAI